MNDDAAVLDTQTAKDIDSLNNRTAASYIVVTRHFLGGKDAQSYCDGLYSAWGLSENDMLLLLVIGEEKYAVSYGTGLDISKEQLNSFLSSKLRRPFLQERDYSGAVGSFLLACAQQVSRGWGEELDCSGLFGTADAAAAVSDNSSANSSQNQHSWIYSPFSGFFSDNDLNDLYTGDSGQDSVQYDDGSGFSIGKMILIFIILSVIMSGRKKRNMIRNGRHRF